MNGIKDHKLKWLLIGLAGKFLLFFVFACFFNQNWSQDGIIKGISVNTADSPDYYQPVERLIKGEGYAMRIGDENDPDVVRIKPWAFRMPGLLPIYGPLYVLFGSEWGRFFVILIQFVLELLSIFLLAQTAERIFSGIKFFYACLLLYILNNMVSVYTFYATSEAFCISLFIISFYFLFKYIKSGGAKNLVFCGLFIGWAIFFRPVMIIFTPVYAVMLLRHIRESGTFTFREVAIRFIQLFSVFILADSIWVARNYKVFHRFIPLNGDFSAVASKQELALYKLIVAWGGDIQDWNPGEGRWFIKPSNSTTRKYDGEFQKTDPFSSYIFTPDYNLDSLKKFRSIYWKAFGYEVPKDSIRYYKNKFVTTSDFYLSSFKKNKPLHYYLLSKLRHAGNFIFIRRPYGLPFIQNNLSNKLIRVCSVLYYYFILLLGVIGIVMVWRKKDEAFVKLFSLGVLLFIAVHSYFGYIEFRYFLPMYPILTLFASFTFIHFINFLNFRNSRVTNTIRT